MEKLKYEIDNNGFYKIENATVIKKYTSPETQKVLIKFQDKNGIFYFKSEGESGDLNKKTRIEEDYLRFYDPYYDGTLAHNDFYILSELYLSKLLGKFGVKSAQYHLASMEGKYGVISRDVTSGGNETKLLCNEVGLFSHAVTGRSDIKYIRNKTNLSPQMIDKLGMLSLFDLSTMQIDRHPGNIMLEKSKGEAGYNNFSVIDHANNGVAIYGYIDQLYSEHVAKGCTVALGVEHTNRSKRRYLKDLRKGEYISKEVVEDYLNTATKLLDRGTMISDINAELMEEYDIPIDEDFGKKLEFSMRVNTNEIERVYDKYM